MRSLRHRLRLIGLALGATLLLTQCQRSGDAPPGAQPAASPAPAASTALLAGGEPRAAATAAGTPGEVSAACCVVTPQAGTASRLGRVIVSFPGDGASLPTRVEVFRAEDTRAAIAGGYGNQSIELLPGTYEVVVGGKRVAGVGVEAGHDTRVRVGVAHVYAGDATRIDFLDAVSGTALAGDYGEKSYGFPVGAVTVEVAGQTETVLIEDDKVTEF